MCAQGTRGAEYPYAPGQCHGAQCHGPSGCLMNYRDNVFVEFLGDAEPLGLDDLKKRWISLLEITA